MTPTPHFDREADRAAENLERQMDAFYATLDDHMLDRGIALADFECQHGNVYECRACTEEASLRHEQEHEQEWRNRYTGTENIT